MEEMDEVQEALETLVEAEKIKEDKALMDKVISLAEEQKGAIKSIADLRKKYDKMVQPKEMPKKEGIKKEADDLDKSDDAAILEKEPIREKGWKDVKAEEEDGSEDT